MGTAISELVPKKEIGLEYLNGRTVGIDAYNTIYQFISIIRGPDGAPLQDSHGNTTSNLSGLLYRTTALIEKGIKPVFVFDGKPHKLKHSTLKERDRIRAEAKEKYEAALKEGNLEGARKEAVRSTKITGQIVSDSKKLLELMGLPVIMAPSEGEAQISVMAKDGKFYGCVSQDMDCLLFGAPVLLRNLAISGKRKMPGRSAYVEVKPEKIELAETLRELGIDRRKLIWLGILIGTDFNEKFPRIGPKTALKLVRENGSFEKIIEAAKHEPEFDYREIEEIFLNPEATKEYEIKFSEPNPQGITDFLVGERDFGEERVKSALEKLLTGLEQKSEQRRLWDWGK